MRTVTLLKTVLILMLGAAACGGLTPAHVACGQTPPPALQDLVEAEWDGPSDVTRWTTAQGDTAYVSGSQQQIFRAHLTTGQTWARCPETTPVVDGDPFPLSAIADSAEVMLREQSGYGINGATLLLAECATTVAAIEDSLREE